jgi:predicted nucleic acid-binding protein
MPDEAFVDANILVYAWDRNEPEKQPKAVSLLSALTDLEAGVLSTQVLGEFFRVSTTRLKFPITPAEALETLESYARSWQVFPVTPQVVLAAARGVAAYQLSYWDAQIWAAARLNGVTLVLSEDFQDGQRIAGLTISNPFAMS